MTTWMIRAGRGGIYAQDWLQENLIGISWDFDGADISAMSKDQIRDAYTAAHPGESAGKVGSAVSQVSKFAHDMLPGATVVMYDPESRLYHLGKIMGPCMAVTDDSGNTYSRAVRWGAAASRDALQTSSKNSLGGISTIFSVSDAVLADLEKAAAEAPSSPAQPGPADQDESDDEVSNAIADDGIERIKDKILKVSPDDMERLVAGLLHAMGYHTEVTPKGPDRGRDVVASPDALGLESPRIICEVKHRKGKIGAPELRSFTGGLRDQDRGLYVSTGGFTKEAGYEADRAHVPVRLLDLDGFARLYVRSYDQTDLDTRAILPLVRVWLPA